MPSRQASIRETRFINSTPSSAATAAGAVAIGDIMHHSPTSSSPVAIGSHDATTTTNGGASSSAPASCKKNVNVKKRELLI
jgi:hypothetical protein